MEIMLWIVFSVLTICAALWLLRGFLRLRHLVRRASSAPVSAIHGLEGKTVLVTGGSGFLGAPLCRTLAASGCRVTVLTRNPEHAKKILDGDTARLITPKSLPAQESFDIIINLAGETVAQRWTEKAKSEILASRLDMTKALVEHIRQAKKKPELFINASAIGRYGTHETTEFTEDTPAAEKSAGAYAEKICAETENAALAAEEYGVRTVLLRTGVVLEIDGGTLFKLAFPFEIGAGGPLGSGRQWFSWIHRADWIGIVLHILTHPDINGAVNATAPAPVTNKEFSTALGRVMRRPAFLPLPAFVLRAVFGGMADEIMLNGQKVLPEKIQKHGYRFLYPDISSAFSRIFSV